MPVKVTKRFVMLGMGSFGTALARKLAGNGCQVIGVDSRRDRLEAVKNEIHDCVIGDDTEREVLEMVELQGLRYAEIAQRAHKRPEAIKMVVFRARRRIHERIAAWLSAALGRAPVAAA